MNVPDYNFCEMVGVLHGLMAYLQIKLYQFCQLPEVTKVLSQVEMNNLLAF